MTFVGEIAKKHGVKADHLLVQYLDRKTRAVDRGSKARRSLGNLYALFVLAEDYVAGTTSRFTDLLSRMRDLPFGSKLQNHPLDNRLNDEFARQISNDGTLVPVQAITVNGQKGRRISADLLEHGNSNAISVAKFVVETVETYVGLITEKQSDILAEIDSVTTIDELNEFIDEAFAPHSDARLFEIVSYVVLAEHFRGQHAFIGPSEDAVQQVSLALFRTGRTNANDGGIDFVLYPYGKFFQVTETLDFRKYFLDFEKVNRFPMSFVIKMEGDKALLKARIRSDAEQSGRFTQGTLDMYMSLFDEVYTLSDLQKFRALIQPSSVSRIKDELRLQFQLEYGLLD